jgi:hypothetical protein
MSDAARHAAHFVAEATYGTTPANPPFKRLRHVGCTLGVQRGSLQSEELRPDRQIADFRLGAISVAGDLNTELSFESFDDLLEAVLMGTWTPKATKTAATLSVQASDDSFNDSANGFVTAGFQVGDLITSSSFTTPANNGTFRITSVAAGKLIVEKPDGTPATALADEAAAAGHKVETTAKVLKAGTVRRSFSLLRHFTDIAASGEGEPYHLFNGVEFNTLAIAVNPTAIVTANFGALGRQGVAPSNTAPSGATFADAPDTAPLDAFTGELREGANVVGEVTEFSINLENGLEVRNVVGSKFTLRPSAGRSNLTGSATVYFESSAFLKKFLNEENTSLSIELPDGEGNSYVLTIPRFKFTGGQPDVSGQGSITLAMPFQGILDPVTASNIIITKIPAAPSA